jgi:hypothetical protein
MKRVTTTLIAVAVVVLSGVVHGLQNERWGPRAELADCAAAIERVPSTNGDWDGRPVAIDARVLATAGAVGHLSQRYVNRSTGVTLNVVLICGRPGPISVHTPDVCFQSEGRRMLGQPAKRLIAYASPDEAPRTSQFFTAEFRRQSAGTTNSVRVYWTWNAARSWSAPDNPRLTFAASPALYKLYVSRETEEVTAPPESDPCEEFLRLYLPELDRALFPL